MTIVLAIIVGALYAAGFYMLLRRSIVKLLIGLLLIGHGANLLIFTAGTVTRFRAPFVPEGARAAAAHGIADPLPQALILTAIVIGFGILAFALTLVHRAHQSTGTDDVSDLTTTDT
jgi:multicomponent Na+:H+ antiporter subunit C